MTFTAILPDSGRSKGRDFVEYKVAQAAGLIVAKLDRLSRSVAVASDIIAAAQAQGWNLVIADLGIDLSTWQGRAMAHMLATFAEVERELMRERTKEGMAAAVLKGKVIGRPRLVSPDITRRIVIERQSGRSYRAIAADLSTSGVLSPEGKLIWQESTVRRIFSRTNKAVA
jgi:DNA invertase Pin-like site-specific DNA recombinase